MRQAELDYWTGLWVERTARERWLLNDDLAHLRAAHKEGVRESWTATPMSSPD